VTAIAVRAVITATVARARTVVPANRVAIVKIASARFVPRAPKPRPKERLNNEW